MKRCPIEVALQDLEVVRGQFLDCSSSTADSEKSKIDRFNICCRGYRFEGS